MTSILSIPPAARRHAVALAAIGLLALAGCAGPSDGSTSAAAGSSAAASMTSPATGANTVSVQDISGRSGVLTAADGRTLYVSDQETGTVRCTSASCIAIWVPLTIPAGSAPTGPDQLAGRLETLPRPDGSAQVSLDHRPLYTFALDRGAGQIGGDQQRDSFDGTDFTWRAATVAAASTSAQTNAPTSGGGGGYGYGY
ncbi:COG4315 family predicted lipoprotein [Nakamurella lactea]|uniref:hypothetical protein n=1 Tax=Nakamurella lactea TaxID=459515 RepID=UPI00041F8BB2|nr:hypothetical protein [Nakamurella lactea]